MARGRTQDELPEVHRITEGLQPLLAAFRPAMPQAIEAFVREEYERLATETERKDH